MLSKPRLCVLVLCVLCSFLTVSWSTRAAQAQVYFTAPYGPGGTWNLYEHRGFLGSERFPDAGQPRTWLEAHQDAISRFEPFSGANVQGHLAAFSGPAAQQENEFVADFFRGEWGSSGWMGLTDDEAFGGGEAGTNGMAGFGNPPGDGIGWKWTSGEVFDFANWGTNSPSEQDSGFLSEGGTWLANYPDVTASYIVEYETHSPTPITLSPMPQPPLLPGPPIRAGAFAIREIANNGSLGEPFQGSLGNAIRSLQNIRTEAIVRDYYAPVIDHQEQIHTWSPIGPNRPFEVLQRGDVPVGKLNDLIMVAHAQILIPEGEGGVWTFAVNSDDGFELYIPGARFESRFVTPYGSMTFPYDTGYSEGIGYVSLEPGIHDLELVYYEHEIHSFVELSAAPGRHSARWLRPVGAFIGAPAQRVGGPTPIVTRHFEITQVQRVPESPGEPAPSEQINSLAQAKQLLASPDANDLLANASMPQIDLTNGANYGRFGSNQSFSLNGNDFAAIATATLSVPISRRYTFGFLVLDGGELTIEGAQFTEVFGEGVITNGGESITLDRVIDDGLVFATVELAEGTYPLEFITYNRDGDAIAELFVAPDRADFFDGGAFTLLGRTSTRISHIYPAGLQLVPEPATVWSAIIGGLLTLIATCLRPRRQKKTPAAKC